MAIQERVRILIPVIITTSNHSIPIFRKGRYSLTVRSIVELQTYITNTFPNDVLHCTICHEMIFRGVRCYTRNCEGMLHSHCYAAYRRARQACPVCSVPWDRDSEGKLKRVGEGAFVEGQDKHARAKRRRDEDEDEDEGEVEYHEDEDGEDPGSTQPSQTQKKGKGKAATKGKASAKAKGKGKERAREESMELDTEEEPAPKRRSSGRNKVSEDVDEDEGEEPEEKPKRKSRRR